MEPSNVRPQGPHSLERLSIEADEHEEKRPDTILQAKGFTDPVFQEPSFRRLAASLLSMGDVVVAYSGGVDSTFLLRVAWGLLGEKCTGVLAFSESLDRNEFAAAKELIEDLGAPFEVLETKEYDNPEYRRNDANRCYHCKTELFDKATKFASERGIPFVLDGSNADDVGDYRPGLRARSEHGVRSPLMEAGLDKPSIRRYSQVLGLATWDKPAAPCLSSRIPYGSEVTSDKLRQVEMVERELRELGFPIVRVRHHGELARVEVPTTDFPRLMTASMREAVTAAVKRGGFAFAAMCLEGFRSGSLNRVLEKASPERLVSLEKLTDTE